MFVNYYSYVRCSTSEGPGKRFAIWVQGCQNTCYKCCNPLLKPFVERNIIDCDDLIKAILDAKHEFNIEGITFSGGEPFLQARSLSYIAKKCKKYDLSVMCYSGYYLDEIIKYKFPGSDQLLLNVDIFIAGPYKDEQRENARNWAGSKNKKFHYITDRYNSEIERNKDYEHRLEISISSDGQMKITGWPYEISDI